MRLVEGGKAVNVQPIKISVIAAASRLSRHLACDTQQCKMGEVPPTSDWLASGTNVTVQQQLESRRGKLGRNNWPDIMRNYYTSVL
jgi:hypothetical protein